MSSFRRALYLASLLLALVWHAAAAQPASLVIGYQAGTFAGLPFAIAEQRGWWRDAGLAPATASFAAPTPQLMAAAAGAWDIGSLTTLPALAGAARYELQAVAVGSDDAGATLLMAPADAAARVRGAMVLVDGWRLLAPATSSAPYVAEACLHWLGIAPSALRAINLMPPEILARFAGEQPALAALAGPQAWQLRAQGAAPVCSGRDPGAALPAFLVVRRAFASEHPDVVRAVVATYLRAVAWIAARPPELAATMRAYYAAGGVALDDAGLRAEVEARTLFPASAQRRLFDRSFGPSALDRAIDAFATFLLRIGFADVPRNRLFLTDAFLPDPDMRPPNPRR